MREYCDECRYNCLPFIVNYLLIELAQTLHIDMATLEKSCPTAKHGIAYKVLK